MVDLKGKNVCITGALSTMTRKQAHDQLEALGAIISKSVTKKTDILFCGERAGMKLEKAEALEIPIYHEADFNKLVGDDAAIERAAAKAKKAAEAPAGPVTVLQEIEDGEYVEVQGSAADPYVLKNTGGVYSCTCPAWRNQSAPIDLRSCKHLAKIRGVEAETARVGRRVNSVSSSKTNAPKVLLAQSWEAHIDPTGYWMSEKLDGVRAIWTGEHFMSRQGNPFHAPDWFVEGFPKTPLDGELWMGRGLFQKTVSVVRRQDKSEHWKTIRYVMFDAPDHGGQFEERMSYMHEEFGGDALEYASVLEHIVCKGVDHLRSELARVEDLKGEGLMLRQAKSKYVGSRSTTLLKVKTFYDAEAKVIGYKGGQGKHRDRVGALHLITPEGVKFYAGTGLSDAERENPPKVGELVTYRFQELTDAGVPRFPTYVGVRIDGEWTGPEVIIAEASSNDEDAKAASEPASAKTDLEKAEAAFAKAKADLEKAKAAVEQKTAEGSAVDESAVDESTANEPAKTKKAPQKEAAGTSTKGVRRFVFGGDTGKFWEVSQSGDTHTVRYGKVGSNGTRKEKTLADEAAAKQDVERLIGQKTGKGYVEVE